MTIHASVPRPWNNDMERSERGYPTLLAEIGYLRDIDLAVRPRLLTLDGNSLQCLYLKLGGSSGTRWYTRVDY